MRQQLVSIRLCSSIIIYFAFYRQILPKPTSAATSSVTGDKNVATIYDANASSSKKKNGANNDDEERTSTMSCVVFSVETLGVHLTVISYMYMEVWVA